MVLMRMRFNVEEVDAPHAFCIAGLVNGYNEVRFEDMHEKCWEGFDSPTVDPTRLKQIQWTIFSTSDQFPFSYCVSEVHVLTD